MHWGCINWKGIPRSMSEIGRYGTVLVVSGPSGVGKTTVCRQLLAAMPDLHLSVSCATRAMRRGEQDGVD